MNASPIVIAGVPSNIRLPPGSRGTHVDSDMHDISSRLREIDPALFVALLESEDGRAVWAVCETARDGVESLIFRVGPGCAIDALDQRVITRIEWIRRVPASTRAAQLQAELDRENVAREADKAERLYDRIGGNLYNNLFKCGFVKTPNPRSVTPLGATAKRHGRTL